MGLFDKLFGSKENKTVEVEIYAPLSGEIVNIEDVPDVVFSEKIVGDGIAIRPTGNKIVAPVDGVIGKIFETNHAFSMESKEGVELFVHFGIDTVELKGEGFTRIAHEGQSVKRGDTVIEFDLATLESKAKSVLTPVVISNMDEISSLNKRIFLSLFFFKEGKDDLSINWPSTALCMGRKKLYCIINWITFSERSTLCRVVVRCSSISTF